MSKQSTDTSEYLDNLRAITKAKGFLGREFLTWFWYQIDTNDGQFKVKAGKKTTSVRAWIDDRVVLEASSQQTHSNTLKGGDPAHSIEAATSLRSGKTVREIKVGLEINGFGPFTAVLTSDGLSSNGLSPRSLSIPPHTDEEDAGKEPISYRLTQIQSFVDTLDGLFALFLDERTSEGWDKTALKNLRTWIKDRKVASDANLH